MGESEERFENGSCLPGNLENILIGSMGNVLFLQWDAAQGYQMVSNRSQLQIAGEQAMLGLDGLFLLVSDEDKKIFEIFQNRITGGMAGSAEFTPIMEDRLKVSVRMKKRDEKYFYYETTCYLMKNDAGAIIHMMIIVCEMTAEEVYRIQLAQSVTNDLNPKMFIRAAKEVIMQNPQKKYAVVQFDVAKFKVINEIYGEEFGDNLLNFFIESLKVICNGEQLFVRLTADVFMILMSYETKQDILDFIETVNKNLLSYKGVTYRLVFGVSYVDDTRQRMRKFGDRAAFARQSIKHDALNHVAFYEQRMGTAELTGKYLEDRMEQALLNHEFVMYLQPKYCIKTGQIVGAEALVRWQQKERGLVSPADFIPLFERNGFVTKMDAYIWEEACKQIRRWIDEGKQPLPISVNMSRIHLRNEKYLTTLEELVNKYQIPREYLEIELTETAEEKDVYQGISKLKELGYTLLMDDFGSGYSSLNTLKDTQFDTIKIDRVFLQDFISSERGKKIVEHVIKMSQSIGLMIVAEGVETKEQAVFLLSCGCNVAQGFFYAKPMSIEEFSKLY